MQPKRPLDKDIIERLEDINSYTPDFHSLKKDSRDLFPVFLVGNEKQKGQRHNLLKDLPFFGKGVTYKKNFILRQLKNDYSQLKQEPFLFDIDKKEIEKWGDDLVIDSNDLKAVEGEVYGLPLRRLTFMDSYHMNSQGTNRKEMFIYLKDSPNRGQVIKAFTYTIDLDYFLDTYIFDSKELVNCPTHNRFDNELVYSY